MWTPVDPVALESTLQFLARARTSEVLLPTPRTFLTEQAKWFPEGSLAEIPTSKPTERPTTSAAALEPGDVVFFHMLTAHHAYGAPGAQPPTRILSLRFLGTM